jgi:hypothetical protein
MPDALDSGSRFAIERACEALTIEYARSVDFRDYDQIVNVFTEDATLVIGSPLEGRAAILHAMMQRPGDSAPGTHQQWFRRRHRRRNAGICYLTLYRHRGLNHCSTGPCRCDHRPRSATRGRVRAHRESWRISRACCTRLRDPSSSIARPAASLPLVPCGEIRPAKRSPCRSRPQGQAQPRAHVARLHRTGLPWRWQPRLNR